MIKKLILILFVLLLAGCSNQEFGADTTEQDKINIEKELIAIEKQQEKENEGKYKYKPKYDKDGVEYEIHEYYRDKGKHVGYQIFVYTDEFIYSYGYGPEAEERTWQRQIATSTQ